MINRFELMNEPDEIERRRQQLAQDVATLEKFTQHWFRHMLATDLGRKDLRAAMRQGG